jgi:hypothetical protein
MILGREPEGERPLGRPRRRWMENIKTDLREIRTADSIDLAPDRNQGSIHVNTVMNLLIP